MNKLEKNLIVVYILLLLVILFNSGCSGPEDGINGKDGAPGSSCSVTGAVGGALISCTDGTSQLILNGQNGADGQDGIDGQNGQDAPVSPYTVVEMIDPCGDGPGHDEVLLRLADNRIVAHYAGGGNLQFLTLLSSGNYHTTDSSSCSFTVGPAPDYVVSY